jgi:hypothetical protein
MQDVMLADISGTKNKEYLKAKMEEFETNSKIKSIRDSNVFKKGHQPRTNKVKDEKGYLVTGSHGVLDRWCNHISQVLNVRGVNEVRQTEIHTEEPIVPELSAFEPELAIEELKSHKSPGVDQIPAELIKVRGKTIYSEIHKLIISS